MGVALDKETQPVSIPLKLVFIHLSKLNINRSRYNRSMINYLRCANLAEGNVKKLAGFEPGRKYHFYYEAGILWTMLLEN